MYKIIAIIGLLIRQFLLPNPFEPFGGWGALYNLFASGAIGLLAYFTVGLFYEKNSLPFLGSLFYTLVYIVYSFELYFIFKPYPNILLMIIIALLTIICDFLILKLIRKAVK